MPIILAFIKAFWKPILVITTIIVLILSARIYAARQYDAGVQATMVTLQSEQLKALQKQSEMERNYYEQTIKAANEHSEREQVIIADAASARDAVTSLSATLSEVTAKAATDANFQRDALGITSNSLKTCSSRYSELATTTDRLANNLRATVEANNRQ